MAPLDLSFIDLQLSVDRVDSGYIQPFTSSQYHTPLAEDIPNSRDIGNKDKSKLI
jgi:hypothetical protein